MDFFGEEGVLSLPPVRPFDATGLGGVFLVPFFLGGLEAADVFTPLAALGLGVQTLHSLSDPRGLPHLGHWFNGGTRLRFFLAGVLAMVLTFQKWTGGGDRKLSFMGIGAKGF